MWAGLPPVVHERGPEGTRRGEKMGTPWNFSVRAKCASKTEHTLLSDPVPPGSILRLDVVAATDETDTVATLELGYANGPRKVPLLTAAVGKARVTVGWQSPTMIPPGWRIYATFRGANTTTDLVLRGWGDLLPS